MKMSHVFNGFIDVSSKLVALALFFARLLSGSLSQTVRKARAMQTYLRRLTLCFTIVLLGISGRVHADDTPFQLTLPLQGTAEESLQQLEIILTTIGAKFRADASPGALITASREDGTHITITHARDRTTNALSFVVQCVGGEGGAEALCQDIARRYRKQ
jgi:hypothetical protein